MRDKSGRFIGVLALVFISRYLANQPRCQRRPTQKGILDLRATAPIANRRQPASFIQQVRLSRAGRDALGRCVAPTMNAVIAASIRFNASYCFKALLHCYTNSV